MPPDGFYSGDFLNLNKIIGVSAVVAKSTYSYGVNYAVDGGVLLGLKIYMESPSAFIRSGGARTSEASP
jgi:hypothetical protein